VENLDRWACAHQSVSLWKTEPFLNFRFRHFAEYSDADASETVQPFFSFVPNIGVSDVS
jgi:hypothetical protein